MIDDGEMGTPIGVPDPKCLEIENYKEMYTMMSFSEYVKMRTASEGLWMPDDNAIPGISKVMPPTPPKKARWPKPPKLKPVPKTCQESDSLSQLDRSVDALAKVGVGLFPPKREDLQRLLDRYKNQVTIPQRPQAPAKAAGRSPGRSATAWTTWGKSGPGNAV